MISIIKLRKIWYTFSAVTFLLAVVAIVLWRLNFGIDFTGGSLLEIAFTDQRPENQQISTALNSVGLNNVLIQPVDEKGVILRFKEVDEETHQKILSAFNEAFGKNATNPEVKSFEEKKFASIGPVVGQELKTKTVWAIILANLAIIIYIAFTFRKVSKPIASWKYGLIAVIALIHDVFITVGFFSFFGHFYGLEINAPFIAALLTVLGYSVHDTIVVFDRTRENLTKRHGEEFETVVETSVNQTLTRSINTSLTVLLTLFAILIFGGSTIRDFVLTLIIGVTFGTYSSIFLASPLLVTWEKFQSKRS